MTKIPLGLELHPKYLMLSLAGDMRLAKERGDSVALADLRTSMADARGALCLAEGIAIDDIDPRGGYDLA